MTQGADGLQSTVALAAARLRKAMAHRRVKAVTHLLTGTAATLGITLLSIALVARLVSPASYGIFAMIITLGQASERLLSFQSWQPLIRSGASIDMETDQASYFSLMKFGWLLDIGGSVTAWFVASALAIGSHFVMGVSIEHVTMTLMFLVSLLFNFNGVATAIFRLTDHYRTIARIQVANALLRLILVSAAYLAGAGLFQLVLVWTITQISGSLANFIMAVRLLPAPGFGGLVRASSKGINDRFPNLWRFALGSNLSLTLWSSAQQVDTLIVGWLADPASAGLFHIAKRLSRVVQQIGSQVESVVYPDLSRLAAAGNKRAFFRVLLQTELLLAAFGAVCFLTIFLAGGPLISLAIGSHFAGAVPLLTVQILAVTLTISGAASRAGLLALGDQRAVLRTVMACTAAFYGSAFLLIPRVGAMGANIAHLVFGAIWLTGLALSLRSASKQATWASPQKE